MATKIQIATNRGNAVKSAGCTPRKAGLCRIATARCRLICMSNFRAASDPPSPLRSAVPIGQTSADRYPKRLRMTTLYTRTNPIYKDLTQGLKITIINMLHARNRIGKIGFVWVRFLAQKAINCDLVRRFVPLILLPINEVDGPYQRGRAATT